MNMASIYRRIKKERYSQLSAASLIEIHLFCLSRINCKKFLFRKLTRYEKSIKKIKRIVESKTNKLKC